MYNLLYSLKEKQDGIANKEKVKNILSNPGIQRAPRIYRKILTPFQRTRVFKPYIIDFREMRDSLQISQPILYIRDINPFEVIKILEIAKANKDSYLSKERFKEILLSPNNLRYINERREDASGETSKSRISKEWWLITPVQLGYLDNDCKITDKGLFLLELVDKEDQEMVRKTMGYDFLNAQGVKAFLKLSNSVFNDPFYKRMPSRASFQQILSMRMKEAGLSSSEANAKKDIQNIFRWLRKFGYSDDSYILNVEKIKEDYTLEED